MFESVNGRTDGRRLESHPISSLRAFGSEELKCIFCLKTFLTLTSSEDPGEMPHYAIFHQGLHCLQKSPFRGFESGSWGRG